MSDLGPLFDGQGVEFGDLQREAHRRQNAADAAQQKAQNDTIIRLLKEQKAEQEREKQRIDGLPKCPECLSPVEVGSRRCAKCQSAIVSWDNRSFRLICLPDDASKHLQARIDQLSHKVIEWAREALRMTEDYAALIKSEIAPQCKVLAATLNKTRPDNVCAVSTVLKSYLADEPLLDPDQLAARKVRMALVDANQHILKTAMADLEKAKLSRMGSGCLSIVGLFFAALLVRLLGNVAVFHKDMMEIAVQSLFLFAAAAIAFRYGYRLRGDPTKERQRLTSATEERDAAVQSCEQQLARATEEWDSRLKKSGITLHLDSLKKATKSANKSAAAVNDFATKINAATTEIAEAMQFAAVVNAGVKQPFPRLGISVETLTPRGLQPQDFIEACRQGQYTGLQSTYDDAMRIAQSLQMLRKP